MNVANNAVLNDYSLSLELLVQHFRLALPSSSVFSSFKGYVLQMGKCDQRSRMEV